MQSQTSQNFHFHDRVYTSGKRFRKSQDIAFADFGTVAYSIAAAKHEPHGMLHAAGCHKQYAVLYRIFGGKRTELVRFHSYHLAAYFWNVLMGRTVNYPLYLLQGFSIACPAGARDIASMARLSQKYVAELFAKIERTYGIVAEAIPVPEGFPLHQKAVILAGLHQGLGYFAGPAVAIPLHEGELDQYVAVYLASAAAAFAKAQTLSQFSFEGDSREKRKPSHLPVLQRAVRRERIAPYRAMLLDPAKVHRNRRQVQLHRQKKKLPG